MRGGIGRGERAGQGREGGCDWGEGHSAAGGGAMPGNGAGAVGSQETWCEKASDAAPAVRSTVGGALSLDRCFARGGGLLKGVRSMCGNRPCFGRVTFKRRTFRWSLVLFLWRCQERGSGKPPRQALLREGVVAEVGTAPTDHIGTASVHKHRRAVRGDSGA